MTEYLGSGNGEENLTQTFDFKRSPFLGVRSLTGMEEALICHQRSSTWEMQVGGPSASTT